MQIWVELTRGPVTLSSRVDMPPEMTGAWVEFQGRVRGEEAGRTIAALEYEAYSPMAENQMKKILTELSRQYPCLGVEVRHRTGVVPVGETAIAVGVAARHRAEAFALLAAFMDRLKEDVPIWKRRSLERLPDTNEGSK